MPQPFSFKRRSNFTEIIAAEHINELQSAIEEMMVSGRLMQVLANANAATLTTTGFAAAPTVTGTATNATSAAGPFVRYTSGTTSGSIAGLNSASGVVRRDWSPVFLARITTGATLTAIRHWIGLFSANPGSSDNPVIHLAAFRYSSAVDSTLFWRTCTDDATGIAVTTTTSPIATSTAYDLAIWMDATSVKFYVDNNLVATHTTKLPTASTLLSWYTIVTTLTSAARVIDIGRVQVVHR